MGASMNRHDIGTARPLDPPAPPPPAAPDGGALGQPGNRAGDSLNDIITVIQSYASILEDSHDTSDTRRQDATQIRLAAERATHLTRQLLTLGQGGVGAPTPALLDEILGGVLPALRRALGARVSL